MPTRLLLLTICFVAAMVLGVRARQPELVPLRQPLATLPLSMDDWRGQDYERFSPEIERILGVEEYVSRWYQQPAAGAVSLYIGYYQSQREGDTIHSPMNCLPGAGWQPVETGRAVIPVAGGAPIEVNRVVIQKGLEKQVALYWYQSHGRVVASEYWSKIFMVYDAARLNRSDAALVRVISPMSRTESEAGPAGQRAIHFVQSLWPHLGKHLPS